MIELRAEPYSLKYGDFKKDEVELRSNLNLKWCRGVLFNIRAFKNNANKVEYDAVLYDDEAILFIEYKNSIKAYKHLKKHEVNQKKDYALNIARAFGFLKYNFIVVVNGLEESTEKVKGKATVISLDELNNYLLESNSFESTLAELDYVNKLLSKYDRLENPVEFNRELALKELKILRDKIEQVNK